MAFNIIKSILLTLVASLSVTVVLYLFGFEMKTTFVVTLLILLVTGFMIGQFTETLAIIKNKQLENDRIKEFSKQGALVECAYCGQENFVPIRLNARNEFNCNQCNEKNVVHISLAAARVTQQISQTSMLKDE